MFSEATPDVAPAGVTLQVGRRSPGDLAVLLRGGIRTQLLFITLIRNPPR